MCVLGRPDRNKRTQDTALVGFYSSSCPLVAEPRSTRPRNLTTGATPGLSRMKSGQEGTLLWDRIAEVTLPHCYDTPIYAIVSRQFRMTAEEVK